MGYEHLNQLPVDVAGLAEAFDNNISDLVGWLLEQSRKPFSPQAMTVVGLAMNSGMSSAQASAIAAEVGGLDSQSLLNLADLLYDVPIWALRQPLAARQLLTRALEIGNDVAEGMRSRMTDAMRVHMYGFENGVSEELDQALEAASRAAAAEPLAALKCEYEKAAEDLAEQNAALGRRHDEEFN
jgi:hypothetical protein